MGLSIRAYARHRGVSHVAVKKAIDSGRITPEPDGTIEPNRADLEWARNAGAKFGTAPGFNPQVVQTAIARNFPFIPGICTPSELEQAVALGCTILKFFPAEALGGTAFLEAIIASYRHLGIHFIPAGGLTPANAMEYLKIPEVMTIGGTWLGKDIPDWEKVAEGIRRAVEALKEVQE